MGAGWRRSGESLLGLATLKLSDGLALHGNLGTARDRASGARASVYNVALAWDLHDQAQVFAEALGNSRRSVFGGTVTGVGGRWWLQKDRFGLDLTASQESGASTTVWTLGLGWYGIGR